MERCYDAEHDNLRPVQFTVMLTVNEKWTDLPEADKKKSAERIESEINRQEAEGKELILIKHVPIGYQYQRGE